MTDDREQAAAIAALDRYWEARSRRATPTSPAPDPTVAATVERFHALPDVPGPDPAFVAGLQRRLLEETSMATTPTTVPASTIGSTAASAPVLPWSGPHPHAARGDARRSPVRRAAELAAVAALLLAILGGTLLGLGALPGRDADGPLAMPAVSGDPVDPGDAPTLRWSARVSDGEGGFTVPPIAADGLVYAAGYTVDPASDAVDEDYLLAYDLATGGERWRLAASALGGQQFGPPALSAGTLFVALSPPPVVSRPDPASPTAPVDPERSALLAIDAATGRERWRISLEETDPAPPLVADGTIYVQETFGATVALDAATGAVRWRVEYPATGRDPDAPLPQVKTAATAGVLVVSGPGAVRGLEAATGTERWRTPAPDLGWFDIAAGDGTVYLGTELGAEEKDRPVGRLRALDARAGGLRWEAAIEGINGGPSDPLLVDGLLIVRDPTDDPTLIALDAATGEERWRREFDGYLPLPPTASGGVLFANNELPGLFDLDFAFLGATDRVIALDLATGEPLWQLDPGSSGGQVSEIAAGDGLVLFHDFGHEPGRSGTLFAYGTPNESTR